MRARWRSLLLFLFLFGLILSLLHSPDPLLRWWGQRLEHWEPLPRQVDALFILLGDAAPRAMYTAALFNEGIAPLVVMAEPERDPVLDLGLVPQETEVAVTVLRRLGVPENRIVVLPGAVTSTLEEAIVARDWAARERVRSIMFVTSSYHSGRALWILSKVLTSERLRISMAAVPTAALDWQPWWRSEEGLVLVFNETVKCAYYWLFHRTIERTIERSPSHQS